MTKGVGTKFEACKILRLRLNLFFLINKSVLIIKLLHFFIIIFNFLDYYYYIFNIFIYFLV